LARLILCAMAASGTLSGAAASSSYCGDSDPFLALAA